MNNETKIAGLERKIKQQAEDIKFLNDMLKKRDMEIEDLKLSRQNQKFSYEKLLEDIEKLEDSGDMMHDDLRDLAEYWDNRRLTDAEKLRQMEGVFNSRFGYADDGRLNLI